MRVAFFGGSFDPPHVGHVLAASYALATETLDKILVVPVYAHAFSKPLLPFEQRLAMTELAMQALNNVEVSAIERDLPSPNYTLQTLRALQQRHPDWELRLLLGSDVFATRDKWQGFDEIETLAPPIVLPRVDAISRWRQINEGEALNKDDAERKIFPPYPAGVGRFSSDSSTGDVLGSGAKSRQLLPEVSSSEIRELLGVRSTQPTRELSELLPASVLAYIEAHGLYSNSKG